MCVLAVSPFIAVRQTAVGIAIALCIASPCIASLDMAFCAIAALPKPIAATAAHIATNFFMRTLPFDGRMNQ
jgi:hypothetical protein